MIKEFRVWDVERKRYIENTGNPYIFPFNGITAMKCAGSSCGSIDGTKDYSDYYIIEQYVATINKQKIYEGDIVSCEEFDDGGKYRESGEIVFHEYGFKWDYQGNGTEWWELDELENPKVIGTIHNKEKE